MAGAAPWGRGDQPGSGGAYADGARQGAPDAEQVSDRWRLLKNLGDALERTLEREHRVLREVERQLAEPSEPATAETPPAAANGGAGAPAPTGAPTVRPVASPQDSEQATVAAIAQACPTAAAGHRLVAAFQSLVREHDVSGLDAWLLAADASALPELQAFAQGIRRDRAAVAAALRLTWSQGQVEGQVNKLKTRKRAMFGRASFALLRQRMLVS